VTTLGSANGITGASGVTRQEVEDFLYTEAELIDSWRLMEWLELFDEDGSYFIPSTDRPDGTHREALYLIADDMPRLRSRVLQLLSGRTWAENPLSRTRHMVSNVRITADDGQVVQVEANFAVFRMRFQNIDPYIGRYTYKLVRQGDRLKIRERRAVLDLEALRPHGKVSFIV
jgi:p-cumate 2,3-dioxygenase beta subunit